MPLPRFVRAIHFSGRRLGCGEMQALPCPVLLPVLVEDWVTGARHRGDAPAQSQLQSAAGMRADVELTPETLRDVLPAITKDDWIYNDKDRAQLVEMPKGLRALAGELRALTVESEQLAEVPAWVGELTHLEMLHIGGGNCFWRPNTGLRALPASIFGQLGALKELRLSDFSELEEIPDLGTLTSLESLTIASCHKLKTLSIGQLGALKQLELSNLDGLQEMPDTSGLTSLQSLTISHLFGLTRLEEMAETLGRMTALERLDLVACELKALPASINHLSRLQHLTIEWCPLQDMPCIEALTALRVLNLGVLDYTHGSRAFQALSRSLPFLQQLHDLSLSGCTKDNPAAVRAEDVLAIGRALRAWPLPLLRDVKNCDVDALQLKFGILVRRRASGNQCDDARISIRLSECWQALGLPAAAADWSNATTLEYFRVQQHNVAAFASGMHARLGAASGVKLLDELLLMIIADKVLGRWCLLEEWRQQERAGEGGSAS